MPAPGQAATERRHAPAEVHCRESLFNSSGQLMHWHGRETDQDFLVLTRGSIAGCLGYVHLPRCVLTTGHNECRFAA